MINQEKIERLIALAKRGKRESGADLIDPRTDKLVCVTSSGHDIKEDFIRRVSKASEVIEKFVGANLEIVGGGYDDSSTEDRENACIYLAPVPPDDRVAAKIDRLPGSPCAKYAIERVFLVKISAVPVPR